MKSPAEVMHVGGTGHQDCLEALQWI